MDDLSGLLGAMTGGSEGGGAIDPSQLGNLVTAVQDEGGLDSLVGKLQGAGLTGEVDSWVGSGANQWSQTAYCAARKLDIGVSAGARKPIEGGSDTLLPVWRK